MMARIYSSVAAVIVWLGCANANASALVAVMEELYITYLNHKTRFKTGLIAQKVSEYEDTEALNRLGLSKWSAERWENLRHFFQNEWFRRVGIYQEVALAEQIHVLWGHTLIFWDLMMDCCAFLFAREGFLIYSGQDQIPLWNFLWLWDRL